jgi:hypothetical protein
MSSTILGLNKSVLWKADNNPAFPNDVESAISPSSITVTFHLIVKKILYNIQKGYYSIMIKKVT